MSENEENGGATFDSWRAMDSSPKDFVPEFVSDEFAPTPSSETRIVEKIDDSELTSDMKCEGGGEAIIEASSDWKCDNEGSIAERRAAKCDFNAVRINTARFKSTSPLSSPGGRSPRLTYPDGISPTALLDSPIMLPNAQAQPSPTTGSFTLPTLSRESSMLNSMAPTADGDKGIGVGSFRFNPHRSPVNLQLLSDLEIQPSMEFALQTKSTEAVVKNCATISSDDAKVSENVILNSNCLPLQSCHPRIAGDQTPHFKEPVYGEDPGGAQNLLERDQKGMYSAMGMARTSEDGYSWRKYGQKQVKGSEYPRSYYKCTHPNCQVKKKVERSHDGQITEIIYKGTHNHPKPQPNRRSVLGSPFSFNEMSEMYEGNRSCGKVEGGVVWRNIQLASKDIKVGADWRTDGSERTSSASVLTEISEPFLTTRGKTMGIFESVGTPELSSTLASNDDDDNDDDEDGTTQRNISLGDDAADEENELKRRKKDNCLNDTNLASRAVREPRVVVEIESEVDILDDGYRWRKYGQKVVKGNPNPRSYYKCTSAGCTVRKHVERASQDLKFIVTTYEGKHNHEVPAARNGSYVNSGGGNLSLAASNTQPPLTLPRSVNVPKPEAQAQDFALCFETKSELGNEYMRSNLLGNFDNSIKFGASSFYQMKFPSVQSTIPYGSFVLNPSQGETQPASSITPVVPHFPMSLRLTNSRPTNMAMAELDFNNHGNPVGSVQSFGGGEQQLRESDVMLLKPKQEQKDDNISDTHLPFVELANGSSSSTSSSVYCQIMGSFPS